MRHLVILLLGVLLMVPNRDHQRQERSAVSWNPRNRDALSNATQVWRRGEEFFVDSLYDGFTWVTRKDRFSGNVTYELEFHWNKPTRFSGIDAQTGDFLRHPWLQPAVQFSCAVQSTEYEDALVFAIERGSLEQRLQALAVLLRVRSPSTVRLQWQVLNELQQRTDRPNWQPLLAEFRECFSERHLAEELQKDPPSDEYASEPSSYYWSIRAAGVVQYEAAIDRLVELSKSDNLDTCIAAERSLEDFTGHRADEALAQCVQGWRYSAYKWAAGALFKRNPRLLEHVLLNANPPEDCRYQVGLFLARLDRPEAVPILCETVPRYQQIDREMFAQIARLGRLEDREIIAALPAHVRPKQRQAAEDAVREFELRIGRIDP